MLMLTTTLQQVLQHKDLQVPGSLGVAETWEGESSVACELAWLIGLAQFVPGSSCVTTQRQALPSAELLLLHLPSGHSQLPTQAPPSVTFGGNTVS